MATIHGDGSDNSLNGTGLADSIFGEAGRETLFGYAGADLLDGGTGDDSLVGGTGSDTLRGLAGNDTLWGQGSHDAIDGGAGIDTVVYADNTTPLRIDLGAKQAVFVGQPWQAEALVSIESAIAGSGDDTLIGGTAANVLDGGRGADLLDGRAGIDTVSFASHTLALRVSLTAGTGIEVASGVTDRLISMENATGGSGDDTIDGTGTANVLGGGLGTDSLSGRGGTDTLLFSFGDDTLDGGGDFDTLRWTLPYDANPDLTWDGYPDYGEGAEGWVYGDNDPDIIVDLVQGTAASAFTGGAAVVRSIENVATESGNDHVYATDGHNVISVGHGGNHVEGRGGNDRIVGSNAINDDRAFFYTFTDYRDANEELRGGGGNDTISGGTTVYGEAGNDTLVAGWASNSFGWDGNRMSGGDGADRFVFSDYFEEEGFHFFDVLAQQGDILDFDAAEGDRIVIDRQELGGTLPSFVGSVGSYFDVPVGSYGFVADGSSTVLYLALSFTTDITGGEHTDGLKIRVDGASVDDVLFG